MKKMNREVEKESQKKGLSYKNLFNFQDAWASNNPKGCDQPSTLRLKILISLPFCGQNDLYTLALPQGIGVYPRFIELNCAKHAQADARVSV
jgi:hypothetical protein